MNRTVSLLSGLVLLLSYPAVGQEAAASREASSQLSGSQLDTLETADISERPGPGVGTESTGMDPLPDAHARPPGRVLTWH